MAERTLNIEIPATDVLHMHIVRSQAARDVLAERKRQDEKWGGPDHDDHHTVAQWVELIQDYAGWARVMAGMDSHDKARRRLVQVAALALAAAESIDRTHGVPVVQPQHRGDCGIYRPSGYDDCRCTCGVDVPLAPALELSREEADEMILAHDGHTKMSEVRELVQAAFRRGVAAASGVGGTDGR